MRKHALLGGSGDLLPQVQENVGFRTSEIASAGLSGQVSVAKIIHISSILQLRPGLHQGDQTETGDKADGTPGCL